MPAHVPGPDPPVQAIVNASAGPTVVARAIDAVSGGSVVNTPSLLVVCPSALVATTSKW